MQNTHNQSWNPSLYDNRAAFVSELGADLVEQLKPQPGELILDVGCGTGDLTAQISRRGAKVLGLDGSAEMIATARSKHPNLEFMHADAQELSFDATFDAVFSNAALHWMLRADDTARGMARALKPNGRLVAEFGGAGCVQTVREAALQVLSKWGVEEPVLNNWYFPNIATYASVLQSAGFSVRWAALFERPTPMVGEDGLRTWLELFCPKLLSRLGADRARFLAEVSELCAPKLYREGHWVLDYVRLRVLALKG
jgi:trans-aconitate methyltransferase